MKKTSKTTTRPSAPSNIEAALAALGVEAVSEKGDEIWALCPMHLERVGKVDRKPSWSVNRMTGLSHCFSCGYSSTFIGLVMDVTKVDSREAFAWVRHNGLTLDAIDNLPGRLDPPQTKKKPAKALPDSLLTGFTEPPEKALEARLLTRQAVERYGLCWDDGGWVLPIRWPDGPLLGYQWKKGSQVLNEPKHMRKAVTLFGAYEFEGKRAILVESPLDVVRLYGEGIRGGLSSFGAHVSDVQVDWIERNVQTLILALDNDQAGWAETRRLCARLGHHRRLPVFVFNYVGARALPGKEGKDPGELERASIFRGIATAVHAGEI
jgi:hypothetical protein